MNAAESTVEREVRLLRIQILSAEHRRLWARAEQLRDRLKTLTNNPDTSKEVR